MYNKGTLVGRLLQEDCTIRGLRDCTVEGLYSKRTTRRSAISETEIEGIQLVPNAAGGLLKKLYLMQLVVFKGRCAQCS